MGRYFVVVLAILLLLQSGLAALNAQKTGKVITQVGEHRLFDGKRILKVSEENGKLAITVVFVESSFPSKKTSFLTKKGTFWLVFPETENKFWFFHDLDLVRFELTDQGINTTNFEGKDVLKNAPKAVQSSFPKQVIDRLKSK
jgi:hypothetical protein